VDNVAQRFLKARARPKALPRVLTQAQMKKLIRTATHPRDRALLEFLYATGCRVGEVRVLRLEDLDFRARTCRGVDLVRYKPDRPLNRSTLGSVARELPRQAGIGCASSLARAHTLSRGRRLDLCQSALPWQDPVYVSNPFPTSHSPCNRASLKPQEQQASADWVAHTAPLTRYIADLEPRECEGRATATSPHHPQDNLGTLRTSGFRRPGRSSRWCCRRNSPRS
jgi:hypothetical protein